MWLCNRLARLRLREIHTHNPPSPKGPPVMATFRHSPFCVGLRLRCWSCFREDSVVCNLYETVNSSVIDSGERIRIELEVSVFNGVRGYSTFEIIVILSVFLSEELTSAKAFRYEHTSRWIWSKNTIHAVAVFYILYIRALSSVITTESNTDRDRHA